MLNVKAFERGSGVRAECHSGSRIDEAADEDEFDVSAAGEQVGDGQAVGENLDGSTEEVLATLEGRGPAVDQNGLTVFD